jgi:enoyl-CoA hydratase/carnithine racemase
MRGVTLRGRGGVFCAGGDLSRSASMQGPAPDAAAVAAGNRDGGRMFERVNALPWSWLPSWKVPPWRAVLA